MTDYRRERQSYVSRTGGDEGGQGGDGRTVLRDICEEDRRRGRLEEEDRGGWRRIADEAVKKLKAAPGPHL